MNAVEQKAFIAKMVADFRAQIADLEALKVNANGWVVKVGPLWIRFDANYSNPRATGVANASVLPTRGEAYRIGKWVQNGGGARGEAQSQLEAINEQIASLHASIKVISELPAVQS